MFYIYIIYSASADKYYVGHSHDPWKRLEQHNTAEVTTYTSKFRPWKLRAVFEIGNERKSAMKMELFIKKQKSRNLIERLVDPGFDPDGRLAQLVRVPHMRD